MKLDQAVSRLEGVPSLLTTDRFCAGQDIDVCTLDNRDLKHQDMEPIGHMGYFRPHAMALWRETLDWLRDSHPKA